MSISRPGMIDSMSIEVIYTAQSTATRGNIDVTLTAKV